MSCHKSTNVLWPVSGEIRFKPRFGFLQSLFSFGKSLLTPSMEKKPMHAEPRFSVPRMERGREQALLVTETNILHSGSGDTVGEKGCRSGGGKGSHGVLSGAAQSMTGQKGGCPGFQDGKALERPNSQRFLRVSNI